MAHPQNPKINHDFFGKVNVVIPLVSANADRKPVQAFVTASISDYDPFSFTFNYSGDRELKERGHSFQNLIEDITATYRGRLKVFMNHLINSTASNTYGFDFETLASANISNVTKVFKSRQVIEDGIKWDLGKWQRIAELEIHLRLRQIFWMELAMEGGTGRFEYVLPQVEPEKPFVTQSQL